MPGEREILAERMAGKTIVGQDAAEVGVIGKQHAVEIEGFALIPVGSREYGDRAWHLGVLIGLDLHADALFL